MPNARKPLTTKFLDALKPEDKLYRVADEVITGLGVTVHPTGRRTFNWVGRINGRHHKLTLGRYPIHSLGEARDWGREILIGRDAGIHVVADKAAEIEAAKLHVRRTCDWGFNLYMDNEGMAAKSAKEKRRIYSHDIAPVIGQRLLDSISHDDLANLLQAKVATAPSVSNHMQALIKRWFKWSVTHGRHLTGLTADPSMHLVKLAPIKTRSRFLDDFELGLLLQILRDWKSPFARPFTLAIYAGARRAEVFEITWAELSELDSRGVWVIPAERTKNGREHILPLADEMIEMLRGVPRTKGSPYLFPSRESPDRAMSGFSKSTKTLNIMMVERAAKVGRAVEPWTIHDLRRSVATGMSGLMDGDYRNLVPGHVVERILNHTQPGIEAVYNRWGYLAEKKAALRLWADHLASI